MLATPSISISPPPARPLRRVELFDGMRRADLADSSQIPVLMELVGALSRADEPRDVLKVFAEGMTKLYGPRGYVSLSTRGLPPGHYRITRMLLGDGTQTIHLADPWSIVQTLPVHTGGFFGELIRSAWPELIHNLNVLDDPVVGDALAPFRSMMAIPLFDGGEPLNWSIQLSEDANAFDIEELEHTILRANLVGGTIRNTLMAKQLREANARVDREVQQIARIQQALLPQSLPEIPGVRFATSYETFDTAGGDLYDIATLNRPENVGSAFAGWIAMLIADASGHGPAAAVLAAMLNAILYAYPGRGEGPGGAFEFANRHLFSKRIEGTFVTAFLAAFDPVDRTLIYARAGHGPPLVKKAGAGNPVRRLDSAGGVPLGIVEHVQFENAVTTLEPGETLVMYTDGVTEALNPRGEMFGVRGIERALEQCSGEPDCVINSIRTALREHEAGLKPADDQTIVAMKVD